MPLTAPSQAYFTERRAKKAAEIFRRPTVHGLTLLVYCLDRFGEDVDESGRPNFLSWDPYTVEMEVEASCGYQLPPHVLDRLMAAISIQNGNDFWVAANRFVALANTLAGDSFDPSVFDPADPWECAVATIEAMCIHPTDERPGDLFSDEVKAYLGVVLGEYGFTRPPWIFDFVSIPGAGRVEEMTTDPDLLQGALSGQEELHRSVDESIRASAETLIEELEDLPLLHGATQELVASLRKVVANLSTA